MKIHTWLAGLTCIITATLCSAQRATSADAPFSRVNGWTIFTEYSNTSSHILMGASRQRELVTLGGGYSRRVVRFWGSQLDYHVEVRPVIFESDPLAIDTIVLTVPSSTGSTSYTSLSATPIVQPCKPISGADTIAVTPYGPETETYVQVCGRRWTFAQAFSPLGFQYSIATHHRVQPFIIGTLGYMYSSRPIPLSNAEAFNFAFDFGPGLEIYRGNKRSIAVECRFHHFSNRGTAQANPGVDNLMYKLSYSFGR